MSEQQFQDTVMAEKEMQESEPLQSQVTFGQIWKTLSAIDVSEQIEIKGSGNFKLKYLSWAWAWGVLMEKYPNADYDFLDPVYFNDGSCEINCRVTIEGNSRMMWLPVMNHKNQSIINPSSRDISDTRMRCLVKCLAMFGLAHYIYAGDDLPRDIGDDVNMASGEQVERIEELATDLDGLKAFYGVSELSKLKRGVAKDIIEKLEAKAAKESK